MSSLLAELSCVHTAISLQPTSLSHHSQIVTCEMCSLTNLTDERLGCWAQALWRVWHHSVPLFISLYVIFHCHVEQVFRITGKFFEYGPVIYVMYQHTFQK